MVTELDKLIRLRKDQIKPASRMLARAFHDDPIAAHRYPDKNDQKIKLPYVYEFLLRYNLRFAQVYATSDNLEGVAIWQYREQHEKLNMSFWQILLSGAVWPALKVGVKVGKRMQPFFECIENKQSGLVPYPHWYLMVIGVDPGYQCKGYASKLMRGMLTRIDEESMPCYLETEKGEHVALYQHFDFEVVEEFIVPDTTVNLWAMLRESKCLKNS